MFYLLLSKLKTLLTISGLFRESCRAVAAEKEEYKNVLVEEQLVE